MLLEPIILLVTVPDLLLSGPNIFAVVQVLSVCFLYWTLPYAAVKSVAQSKSNLIYVPVSLLVPFDVHLDTDKLEILGLTYASSHCPYNTVAALVVNEAPG